MPTAFVTFTWLDWELKPRSMSVRICPDPEAVKAMLEGLLDTEVGVLR